MSKTQIFTIVLLIPIGIFSYFLYDSIATPIYEAERIKKAEEEIIAKLKVIRELQVYYYANKGTYAKSFEQLQEFVKNGEFWNINKKEIDLGNDSVKVVIDTLGKVPVKDSLAKLFKKAGVDISNLAIVPGSEPKEKFVMDAGEIETGNVNVAVFEVRDPKPINPDRRNGKKKPLKVGSMKEATTAGTWE